MALASRSSSLPLRQLLRCASSSRLLGTLYRQPPSARLQLSAAASSFQEAAGHDGIVAAAATTCVPLEVVDAAAAEQLGKARRGAPPNPHTGWPSQPKEDNHRETHHVMWSPSPPGGQPIEGPGDDGGDHH